MRTAFVERLSQRLPHPRDCGRPVKPAPLALALLAATASPATATTFTFSVVTTSPVTAPAVTLNGDDQTKTVSIVTKVAYTGSGNTAGWKVQAAATTPTAAGGATLPALTVTAGSSACAGSCTTNPTSSVTYPITLSGTAQRIYNAAANTGRGTFNITSTFTLTYPANALAGTYTSTVTLTGATGP